MVLTPREIWHHCEGDHHEVHSKSEVHLEQEDCFACDFELATASKPVIYLFVFNKTVYPKFNTNKTSSFQSKKFFSFSHRGPPVV